MPGWWGSTASVRLPDPTPCVAWVRPRPTLYDKAQAIIGAQDDDNRWMHTVKPTDRLWTNSDLFLIHHFDNRARSTSLKVLEFNMRADNISDLLFPVGTSLALDQVPVLKKVQPA